MLQPLEIRRRVDRLDVDPLGRRHRDDSGVLVRFRQYFRLESRDDSGVVAVRGADGGGERVGRRLDDVGAGGRIDHRRQVRFLVEDAEDVLGEHRIEALAGDREAVGAAEDRGGGGDRRADQRVPDGHGIGGRRHAHVGVDGRLQAALGADPAQRALPGDLEEQHRRSARRRA